MKKLLTIAVLLATSFVALSQTNSSEYNKNSEVVRETVLNRWYYDKVQDDDAYTYSTNETFTTSQSKEGYDVFYKELLKVINFYHLTAKDMVYCGSIPKNTQLTVNSYLKFKAGDQKFAKLYDTSTVRIIVACTEGVNTIAIMTKFK